MKSYIPILFTTFYPLVIIISKNNAFWKLGYVKKFNFKKFGEIFILIVLMIFLSYCYIHLNIIMY